MHKARKEMRETLPRVDLIIEILDARIPFSSENPMIAELRGNKPCIKVLNKTDLADASRTTEWQNWLEQENGVKTLAVSKSEEERIKGLSALCHKLVPARAEQHRAVHAMIMGIPNVGKSTLINCLAGRVIAKTGNEPAITRQQQRIKLDSGVVLHDTPGVLWPNVENGHSGYRLAVTGAIRDTAINYEDIAWYAMDFMRSSYPQRLQERYGLQDMEVEPIELLEQIGRQRGCLRGGGQVDWDKASRLFLTELRSGQLGPLTLETPSMMRTELDAVAEERQRKAEQKAARRKKS